MLTESPSQQRAIEIIARILLADYCGHAYGVIKRMVNEEGRNEIHGWDFGGWTIGSSAEKGSFKKQGFDKTINAFLKERASLRIALDKMRTPDARGITAAGHYDPRMSREILLFVDGDGPDGSFPDIVAAAKTGHMHNLLQAIAALLKTRYSVMVHELTHAYHDWVSNGEWQNNPGSQAAIAASRKARAGYYTGYDDQEESKARARKLYMLDPVEIEARFVQHVSDIKGYLREKWPDYLRQFKQTMRGWQDIPKATQERLMKRLAVIWAHDRQPQLRDITGACWKLEDEISTKYGLTFRIDSNQNNDIVRVDLIDAWKTQSPVTPTKQGRIIDRLVMFADMWKRTLAIDDPRIFSPGLLQHYGFVANKGRNKDYRTSAPFYRVSRRAD